MIFSDEIAISIEDAIGDEVRSIPTKEEKIRFLNDLTDIIDVLRSEIEEEAESAERLFYF